VQGKTLSVTWFFGDDPAGDEVTFFVLVLGEQVFSCSYPDVRVGAQVVFVGQFTSSYSDLFPVHCLAEERRA